MAKEKISILGLQIGKFAIVGFINTVVDFLVLNLLVRILKFESTIIIFGFTFLVANIISVTAAMVNSYFFNKYWTFKSKRGKDIFYELFKFFIITILGMFVIHQIVFNFFYSYWLIPTNVFINFFHFLNINSLDSFITLNFAKFLAILVSMIWNFVFYKLWVFKNNGESD